MLEQGVGVATVARDDFQLGGPAFLGLFCKSVPPVPMRRADGGMPGLAVLADKRVSSLAAATNEETA